MNELLVRGDLVLPDRVLEGGYLAYASQAMTRASSKGYVQAPRRAFSISSSARTTCSLRAHD